MKLNFVIAIVICLLSSCQHKTSNEKTIELIGVKDAFEKRKSIKITDISKDLEFIVLESTDESLIENYFTLYADDKYLISISRKQIMLFDRESGRFIRKIGIPGRGPNEYALTAPSMPYNEEKKVIYTSKNLNERYEYDLEGNLVSRKKGPDQVYDFVNVNENTFVSFIDNYSGQEKRKLVIFNQQDSIIKIFPNYQTYPSLGKMFVYYPDAWFYKVNGDLCFCEKFNDTLFTLTPATLTPRYVLDKGLYSFPYELRGDINEIDNKYFITENIIESSRYLFYVFIYKKMIYTALYDKKQQTTIVNDNDGEWGNGYIKYGEFIPLEISSITKENELICTMDAYKIKSWFDSNPEKVKDLSEPLQKLKNISETQNPVVIISKLNE